MTSTSRRIRIFLKGVSTKFIMAQGNHADWLVQRNRDHDRELPWSLIITRSLKLDDYWEYVEKTFNSHSKQFHTGYRDVPGKKSRLVKNHLLSTMRRRHQNFLVLFQNKQITEKYLTTISAVLEMMFTSYWELCSAFGAIGSKIISLENNNNLVLICLKNGNGWVSEIYLGMEYERHCSTMPVENMEVIWVIHISVARGYTEAEITDLLKRA